MCMVNLMSSVLTLLRKLAGVKSMITLPVSVTMAFTNMLLPETDTITNKKDNNVQPYQFQLVHKIAPFSVVARSCVQILNQDEEYSIH